MRFFGCSQPLSNQFRHLGWNRNAEIRSKSYQTLNLSISESNNLMLDILKMDGWISSLSFFDIILFRVSIPFICPC